MYKTLDMLKVYLATKYSGTRFTNFNVISIALVTEHDEIFYGENLDWNWDPNRCSYRSASLQYIYDHSWRNEVNNPDLKEMVYQTYDNMFVMTDKARLCERLLEWIDDLRAKHNWADIQLYCDNTGYDYAIFNNLIGEHSRNDIEYSIYDVPGMAYQDYHLHSVIDLSTVFQMLGMDPTTSRDEFEEGATDHIPSDCPFKADSHFNALVKCFEVKQVFENILKGQ